LETHHLFMNYPIGSEYTLNLLASFLAADDFLRDDCLTIQPSPRISFSIHSIDSSDLTIA
jgi:hypothetical protein